MYRDTLESKQDRNVPHAKHHPPDLTWIFPALIRKEPSCHQKRPLYFAISTHIHAIISWIDLGKQKSTIVEYKCI